MDDPQHGRNRVYFAGAPGGGSVALPAHNYIAQCLKLDWKMSFLGATILEDMLETFRKPDFAGGIVTMPYKKSIIPHLDEVDEIVSTLGACNHISLTKDGSLRGTNTDWIGVRNALLQAGPPPPGSKGMIIGAGGASRAAVYALGVELGCKDIYVINRDDTEVMELVEDVQNYDPTVQPRIIHVRSVEQACTLTPPYYVVGTVPDFEPTTPTELQARAILEVIFSKKFSETEQGVMLDMNYHPLTTRNLQLAIKYGRQIVDGVQVVGHQLKEQWRLWTGKEIDEQEEAQAWRLVQEGAKRDPTVTKE